MPHFSLNYIKRGDPSVYDFTKEDFITDLQWHDLDLSNVVPEGTKLVRMKIKMVSSSLGGISFREKGNINEINQATIKIQVSNIYYYEEFDVNCDSNRKIEYLASDVPWTVIDIIIRGWFK